MAYRKVYLRIKCSGYDPFSTRSTDLTVFKAESRRLFQDLGWTLHEGGNGVCDTVTKGCQDLYLHPQNFSGVLEEANIPLLREQLARAQSFQCYAADCYEEYLDMSDKDRENRIGRRFVSELITQLLQEGRLVAADTAHGVGIRAATAKEIRLCSQPVEQVNGQITMTF